MSALVSGQGALFVTETGARSASAGGAFLSETASTGAAVDLTGDLSSSVTFAADLTLVAAGAAVDFAGSLTLSPIFGADLAVDAAGANYVDFTGNLGGVSRYGRRAYGVGHYSRIDAFAPAFAGEIDIVGQLFFVGELRPAVTFAGDLTFFQEMAGELVPAVTFAGDLSLWVDLAGDMAPQIVLDGSLSLDLPLTSEDGSFAFTVVLEASELISQPLWGAEKPCPPPVWGQSEPPPSIWTPEEAIDPVEWEDTELCNG